MRRNSHASEDFWNQWTYAQFQTQTSNSVPKGHCFKGCYYCGKRSQLIWHILHYIREKKGKRFLLVAFGRTEQVQHVFFFSHFKCCTCNPFVQKQEAGWTSTFTCYRSFTVSATRKRTCAHSRDSWRVQGSCTKIRGLRLRSHDSDSDSKQQCRLNLRSSIHSEESH